MRAVVGKEICRDTFLQGPSGSGSPFRGAAQGWTAGVIPHHFLGDKNPRLSQFATGAILDVSGGFPFSCLTVQPAVSSIETATACVMVRSIRSPDFRAAAKSRISGFTTTFWTTPSGVMKVAIAVFGS